MRLTLIVLLLFLCSTFVSAQELPDDYLTPAFHKAKRQELRAKLPKNSVAVMFANPVRNRANDVDYLYHQDPNFYYLTGYKEPHSILVIFSEMQTTATGEKYDEVFFAQKRDPRSEMWNGRRLGVEGVKEKLGFEVVKDHNDFESFAVNFDKFDKVLFIDFKGDIRDKESDNADLYSLKEQFKDKAGIPENFNAFVNQAYVIMKNAELSYEEKKQNIYNILRRYPRGFNDPIIDEFMKSKDNEVAMKVSDKAPNTNLDVFMLPQLMGQLREIKTAEELVLLRKAVDISCVGQVEVMKAMRPNMSETEVQGIHEFVFKKYGAEYEGYPSIVGAGNNGCILHYIENNRPTLGGDLVLMDLGAEYHGYTADVTRTIPANGKFTKEQRIIYEIVLEAQNAGIEECLVGNSFWSPNNAAKKVIDKRLAEYGIIKEGERHNYLPHGTSHYIGLDVHDPGTYQPFQPNTVITVEPGIYIPEGSPCDEKWWGIAVRIEDDILITEDGWELLSDIAPREVDEIEAMMAKSSPLDNFILPNIDNRKE
ncbi:MAG: aminopeptidase P N-terminal domain-containing protein [Bacteroidota bacterium]